jgi:hypothetical protein
MTDAIDMYLDTILTPQLEHLGVQSFPSAIEAVVTDIRLRLQSVLFRWHDLRTRNTLLLLGREEGAFYEPRSAPLEIRAFVVVAVRNSLLEDLGIPGASLIPADIPEEEKPMQEADVRPITESAISYWQTIDVQRLHVLQPAAEDDPFGRLPKPGTFSLAWRMPGSVPLPLRHARRLVPLCPKRWSSTIQKNALWCSAGLHRSLIP